MVLAVYPTVASGFSTPHQPYSKITALLLYVSCRGFLEVHDLQIQKGVSDHAGYILVVYQIVLRMTDAKAWMFWWAMGQ